MKKLKDRLTTLVFVVVFIAGLSLLLYPTFSNWWNTYMVGRSLDGYSEYVEQLDESEKDSILRACKDYNASLVDNMSRFYPSLSESQLYRSLLSSTGSTEGSSIMGSIEIPSIKVSLPIYHGTSEDVLAIGAGHMEGSSLPVGGLGTHAIITGHRGLPSAMLFTKLDALTVGDYFVINVLGEQLTYEVESVKIVLPEEMKDLEIDPDKDLCTLVTCTPYGINTHRILVTGRRTANKVDFFAASNATFLDKKMVALVCAIPMLICLLIVMIIRSKRKKITGDTFEDEEIEY